jgi:hypothetical protein
MKHLAAILTKFVIVAIILEVVYKLMTNLSFGKILMIALAVTAISYLIGDLLILAISNNTIATLSDAVLAFVTIYLFDYVATFGSITITNALIAAVVIGIGEWFFHKYMVRYIYPDREHDRKKV